MLKTLPRLVRLSHRLLLFGPHLAPLLVAVQLLALVAAVLFRLRERLNLALARPQLAPPPHRLANLEQQSRVLGRAKLLLQRVHHDLRARLDAVEPRAELVVGAKRHRDRRVRQVVQRLQYLAQRRPQALYRDAPPNGLERLHGVDLGDDGVGAGAYLLAQNVGQTPEEVANVAGTLGRLLLVLVRCLLLLFFFFLLLAGDFAVSRLLLRYVGKARSEEDDDLCDFLGQRLVDLGAAQDVQTQAHVVLQFLHRQRETVRSLERLSGGRAAALLRKVAQIHSNQADCHETHIDILMLQAKGNIGPQLLVVGYLLDQLPGRQLTLFAVVVGEDKEEREEACRRYLLHKLVRRLHEKQVQHLQDGQTATLAIILEVGDDEIELLGPARLFLGVLADELEECAPGEIARVLVVVGNHDGADVVERVVHGGGLDAPLKDGPQKVERDMAIHGLGEIVLEFCNEHVDRRILDNHLASIAQQDGQQLERSLCKVGSGRCRHGNALGSLSDSDLEKVGTVVTYGHLDNDRQQTERRDLDLVFTIHNGITNDWHESSNVLGSTQAVVLFEHGAHNVECKPHKLANGYAGHERVNLAHHLQVDFFHEQSPQRLDQVNEVRHGGGLGNQLHRVLALAALDFLGLRRVALSVFFLTNDAKDVIHNDIDDGGQTVVEIAGAKGGHGGNQNRVHGVRQDVQLVTAREGTSELLENEAKVAGAENDGNLDQRVTRQVSGFVILTAQNMANVSQDSGELLGHFLLRQKLEQLDDDDTNRHTVADFGLVLFVEIFGQGRQKVLRNVDRKLGLGSSHGKALLPCWGILSIYFHGVSLALHRGTKSVRKPTSQTDSLLLQLWLGSDVADVSLECRAVVVPVERHGQVSDCRGGLCTETMIISAIFTPKDEVLQQRDEELRQVLATHFLGQIGSFQGLESFELTCHGRAQQVEEECGLGRLFLLFREQTLEVGNGRPVGHGGEQEAKHAERLSAHRLRGVAGARIHRRHEHRLECLFKGSFDADGLCIGDVLNKSPQTIGRVGRQDTKFLVIADVKDEVVQHGQPLLRGPSNLALSSNSRKRAQASVVIWLVQTALLVRVELIAQACDDGDFRVLL
ncbi:hypothetical protein HC256_000907 [Beauveria bassiana]|nr:hypothetical protein HC256_000907 [Beauveria bassiana]